MMADKSVDYFSPPALHSYNDLKIGRAGCACLAVTARIPK
jgi:hypothetical protein